MNEKKENSIKVWQYFSFSVALIAVIAAFLTRPNVSELSRIKNEIKFTNTAIVQAVKEPSVQRKHKIKTFNLIKAEKIASERLKQSIEMALGGYQDSLEYNRHRSELNSVLGKKLTTRLYKMNGNPETAYMAPDNAKLKFTITKRGIANIGFTNVADPQHTQICVVVRYNPDYLSYGIIKIINLDYNLEKQTVNSAKFVNLKNAQLKGYYEEND